MSNRAPLPEHLGEAFTWARARESGVSPSRLRAGDLEHPFRGVRMRAVEPGSEDAPTGASNQYGLQRDQELALIVALGRGLLPSQFLSHRSAALLWGAPMPWTKTPRLHAAAVRPATRPRIGGVTGHSIGAERCEVRWHKGIPVADPAATWAMLAELPLVRLVAVGDFFARRYRQGWGRPNPGRPPLAPLEDLQRAVSLGRWRGQRNLERALPLIREDSWSPMESAVRIELVTAGLPEPSLNVDLFGDDGSFLGCVDMAFAKYRIAVEYQSAMHSGSYAADIEKIERLRAAGWIVIQVTSALAARPRELVRRVAAELRSRGWTGSMHQA